MRCQQASTLVFSFPRSSSHILVNICDEDTWSFFMVSTRKFWSNTFACVALQTTRKRYKLKKVLEKKALKNRKKREYVGYMFCLSAVTSSAHTQARRLQITPKFHELHISRLVWTRSKHREVSSSPHCDVIRGHRDGFWDFIRIGCTLIRLGRRCACLCTRIWKFLFFEILQKSMLKRQDIRAPVIIINDFIWKSLFLYVSVCRAFCAPPSKSP